MKCLAEVVTRALLLLSIVILVAACSRKDATDLDHVPQGSTITIEQQDGVTVEGRLVEVRPEHIVVEARGQQTRIPRNSIAAVRAPNRSAAVVSRPADSETRPVATSGDRRSRDTEVEASPEAVLDEPEATGPAVRASEPRTATLPTGTSLKLTLRTSVASDESRVEDAVRATLRERLVIDGVEVLPAGTVVTGHVTSVKRAARVKGRGQIALRFTAIDLPGPGNVERIRTTAVTRIAPGTKKRDAATIGGGAVGGAIIGGILGGGDGAAKGAVVGGAAGTGAVLATRGREVRLPAGTPITVRLSEPVTVPIDPE